MRQYRTYNQVAGTGSTDLPDQVDEQLRRVRDRLARVGAVWLVASGKGGVGKSAIAANLAAALADRGLRIGALDADLNGPSLARMLSADRGSLRATEQGVSPAVGVAGTRVMSMDLLLGADDAPVRWREPESFGFVWQSALETGTFREFIADVEWGDLDALVVDLPPGTDKLIRAFQLVPDPAGVLLVTTPSDAARSVVHRSLRLVREHGAPVALVANMTGHVCGSCGHEEPLFQADGARRLADEASAEIWAEVPFHAAFARDTDAGRPPVLDHPPSPAAAPLLALVERVAGASAEAAAGASRAAASSSATTEAS